MMMRRWSLRMPSQMRATAYSGVRIGSSHGTRVRTPSNMPVEM